MKPAPPVTRMRPGRVAIVGPASARRPERPPRTRPQSTAPGRRPAKEATRLSPGKPGRAATRPHAARPSPDRWATFPGKVGPSCPRTLARGPRQLDGPSGDPRGDFPGESERRMRPSHDVSTFPEKVARPFSGSRWSSSMGLCRAVGLGSTVPGTVAHFPGEGGRRQPGPAHRHRDEVGSVWSPLRSPRDTPDARAPITFPGKVHSPRGEVGSRGCSGPLLIRA